MDIYKIVKDFEDCRNKNTCLECEASKQIGNSGYTYCNLLEIYGRGLLKRISELITGN